MPAHDADSAAQPEVFHESTTSLTLKIIFLQFLLALLSASLILTLFYLFTPPDGTNILVTLLILSSIVLHTIDAGILIYLVLRWKNTAYSISPKKVMVQTGGPNMRAQVYNTGDLKELEVDQSLLGRLFDYGTVSFIAPGQTSRVILSNISHPWQHVERILQAQGPAH
jgi:uncharacterized membrane protein YdbT with pleckstrin-like domain